MSHKKLILLKRDNLQSNFGRLLDDGLLRQSGNFNQMRSVLTKIENLDRAFLGSGVQDLTAVVNFKLNQGILLSEVRVHEALDNEQNLIRYRECPKTEHPKTGKR